MLMRRFSRMELTAVMLVAAIVMYELSSRTLRYFEVAEKAALTITVLEVERGIRVRLALAALGGAPAPTEKFLNTNPFELARAVPPNYLGELRGQTDLSELKPGNWFYDRDRNEIAYLPRLTSRLRDADGAALQVLRFRLTRGAGSHALPQLSAVSAYQWDPEFGTF